MFTLSTLTQDDYVFSAYKDAKQLVEFNGSEFIIRDKVVAKYIRTIFNDHQYSDIKEIQFCVSKICNLEKMFTKISTKEEKTTKYKLNELLKFLYNKNIYDKITAIIANTTIYFPTIDFNYYEYNIYEVIDCPTFYIIEQRERFFKNAIYNNIICYLFIHKNNIFMNFNKANNQFNYDIMQF